MTRLRQSLRSFYDHLCSRIEASAERHEAEVARLRAELAKHSERRPKTSAEILFAEPCVCWLVSGETVFRWDLTGPRLGKLLSHLRSHRALGSC